MDKNQQIESFNNFVEKQREVMLSKGDDYANEDRLSNFKSAAYICGLTPAQHCLAMIATKVARLGVLLNPGAPAPKNEAVQDSVLDLANYAQLLNMILEENSLQEKGPSNEEVCCGGSCDSCSRYQDSRNGKFYLKCKITCLIEGTPMVFRKGDIVDMQQALKIWKSGEIDQEKIKFSEIFQSI